MYNTILSILITLLMATLNVSYDTGLPPLSYVLPNPVILDSPTPIASNSAVLGAQTKSNGCMIRNNSPDPECSPGAVFAGVTKEQVCKLGYSKTVRNVSTITKSRVYAEYSITAHPTGAYEVDHIVPLGIGGSNDIANLWPQPAEPKPGFHEKDKVENFLHDQVCYKGMPLEQAQQIVARDWLSILEQISN